MKKINKIISVVMMILLLFSYLQSTIYAVTFNQDVNLYKTGDCDYTLQYNSNGVWKYIRCSYIVYNEDGKTYPAYCLNKELDGAEKYSYNVNLAELINDNRLWRVVINGYPYKTPSEMGVENNYDAFLATKQAIYSILYDTNVDTYYRGGNERGTKIFNAIRYMVNEGRYGTYTPQNANITLSKSGNLKDEGEYCSQEYNINSSTDISTYTITNIINAPNGSYIADINNNEKTTFNGGENFKIMIPKTAMISDFNINIYVQAKCKTYPVFYGKTYISGTQNYLITADYYGESTGETTLNIETNTGKIIVKKTDNETNEPIPNTVFTLVKSDGEVIGNVTTNEDGIAEFNYLYPSEYILKEISANEDYILNAEDRIISLNYGETKTEEITNEHKYGNLVINKVDKDNNSIPIGDVEFDLFSKELNKVVGTYKTDNNGKITINKLRTGEYSLIEKSTNKWYNLADNKEIKIEWDKLTEETVENELKKGKIRIIKVDKENNEIKLAGVKFNILDENNKILETITTNSNGEALTSEYPIRDYKNLKIQESQTLSNYVLNDEIKIVELKENEITNITFGNELKKGQIRVIKVDLDNNEVKIPGVEFEVYDDNNKLVDKIITDEKGEAVTKRLRIDKEYTIKETKTLKNYVLSEEMQTVTLKEDEITNVTFENELKKGQIRVIKVDLDNNEVRIPKVEFEVYDEDNKLVDKIITDEKGEAVTKRLRIDKEYTIKETKTLSNYVLSEEIQTVTLKEDEITNVTFENEKIKGYIQITKTSSEYNKYSELEKDSPLADVSFEIYDNDNNYIDTISTDENGIAITKELVKGKYKIKEVKSAKYYLLNENIYEAEINKNQEIVNVDIKNDNVDIDVEVEKKGFIETQSKDEIFYNFSNIKNNSNVPLDNFTWSDELPVEAVRINKIYTGTWNEELEYDVYYKTNKSEKYNLFKEKLNTQKIYELDFSNLELTEDEYVTHYEFRFGTVKVGFQEIESPILYCKMLDGLGNGFIFTNNTKVSGSYFEKYVEDRDEWTTITYFKEIEINETLPKTRLLD